MRTIKLTLQYDGTDYSGWQSQSQGETTIQSTLCEAIKNLTGQSPDVIAAGRTDSGVHALAQVAAFKTGSTLAPDVIKRALNAMLPRDIRITDAADAADGFHPRHDAKIKRYFYLIANADHVPPFINKYVWHIAGSTLNVNSMADAAGMLIGSHDFRAFMAAGSSVKTTIRTIEHCSVKEHGSIGFLGFELSGRFIKISVSGDGFLRHMVRAIAGSLVEIGKGRHDPAWLSDALKSLDRSNAGPTAPAKGLFLEGVDY